MSGVDPRLRVAALLGQLEGADEQVQQDPDVRNEEDREQPRHRGGRLAALRDDDERRDLDGEVDEGRDDPDGVGIRELSICASGYRLATGACASSSAGESSVGSGRIGSQCGRRYARRRRGERDERMARHRPAGTTTGAARCAGGTARSGRSTSRRQTRSPRRRRTRPSGASRPTRRGRWTGSLLLRSRRHRRSSRRRRMPRPAQPRRRRGPGVNERAPPSAPPGYPGGFPGGPAPRGRSSLRPSRRSPGSGSCGSCSASCCSGIVILATVLIPLVIGMFGSGAAAGGDTADETAAVAAVELYDEAWAHRGLRQVLAGDDREFREALQLPDCDDVHGGVAGVHRLRRGLRADGLIGRDGRGADHRRDDARPTRASSTRRAIPMEEPVAYEESLLIRASCRRGTAGRSTRSTRSKPADPRSAGRLRPAGLRPATSRRRAGAAA